MKTRELPGKISPGDELEVQLAPFGDWPNTTVDEHGKQKEVVQHVTAEAVSRLVANFTGEVLVDVDHESIEGGTEAAAWVTGLRADPDKGLVGTFRFTDTGADAVSNRRYRFVSVAWILDEGGEPCRLDSVALTNRPNLPVRPILNRQPPVRNNMFTEGDMASSTAGGGSAEHKKDTPHMDKIKQMLGLEPDADESAVEAAVKALIDAKAAAEAEKAEAEAEQFAAANEDKCDRETLKNAYLKSPETAKAIVAGIKTAKAPADGGQKLLNAAAAKAPAIGKATREQLAALPPGERAAFYKAHKADFTN